MKDNETICRYLDRRESCLFHVIVKMFVVHILSNLKLWLKRIRMISQSYTIHPTNIDPQNRRSQEESNLRTPDVALCGWREAILLSTDFRYPQVIVCELVNTPTPGHRGTASLRYMYWCNLMYLRENGNPSVFYSFQTPKGVAQIRVVSGFCSCLFWESPLINPLYKILYNIYIYSIII